MVEAAVCMLFGWAVVAGVRARTGYGRSLPPASAGAFRLCSGAGLRRMTRWWRGGAGPARRRRLAVNPFKILLSLVWSLRGLLVLAGVAVFVAGGWCVLQRDAIAEYFQSLDVRDQERARVDQLGSQVRELELERERLSKDATFEREKVARTRFHWSRPDERVLILQGADESGARAEAPTSATALALPILPNP